jgi:hypothetical protein
MFPVDWGGLRKVKPVSAVFGLDRGMPIDRYYIEKFLESNSDYIKGNIVEIAENTYSKKFCAAIEKSKLNILHYSNVEGAKYIGDLTDTSSLPENEFDCFICTQTFNFIFDLKSAIHGSHYLLKEGGVLLATLGGISQISKYDMDRWGDYWRFTVLSAKKLFEEVYGEGKVEVSSYGNVLSSIAFLEGISSGELKAEELDANDINYQLLITVKAIK